MLFLTIMQGMVVKPIFAVRMFGYSWGEFIKVFMNNAIVFIASATIPSAIVFSVNIGDGVITNLSIILLSILTACTASYMFGLSKNDRKRVNQLIKAKIYR